MTRRIFRKLLCGTIFAALCVASSRTLKHPPRRSANTCGSSPGPTHADILRGEYGEFRANNDLLSYHLDVRVDPGKEISERKKFCPLQNVERRHAHPTRSSLRAKCGQNCSRHDATEIRTRVRRRLHRFPEKLKAGHEYTIDFYYSGNPVETARFGGITFKKDSSGHPWINTACEDIGASVWWPNKDQWRDEVENMQISV